VIGCGIDSANNDQDDQGQEEQLVLLHHGALKQIWSDFALSAEFGEDGLVKSSNQLEGKDGTDRDTDQLDDGQVGESTCAGVGPSIEVGSDSVCNDYDEEQKKGYQNVSN